MIGLDARESLIADHRPEIRGDRLPVASSQYSTNN